MKNLYLIQIQNVIAERIFLPLASGYLWSYASSHEIINKNYQLKDVIFIRKDVEYYLNEIENPEVVAIGAYVWNWEYSCILAKEIKKRFPKCLIIVGGPHAPYQEVIEETYPFIDLIATNAGEEQFTEILIEHLNETPDYTAIQGVIESGKPKQNDPQRKRLKDINCIPSPYLTGFFDVLIEKYPDHLFNIVIETNRGCPYSCTFCDMQSSFYQAITIFDMNRVKEEIDWAIHNEIAYIDCADSNFGIFKRDIEIADYVAKIKKRTGFPKMFNYTSAKNQPKFVEKIQQILGEANIDRGISVALQSLNPETLTAIKRWNKSSDEIDDIIKKYKKNQLECYVELILGLPNESKETWINGINHLLDNGFENALLIHPLSVVPNTPFTNIEYKKKYSLSYTKTRSPAQGFCYGTESPEERETICHSSSTMTTDDWIESYIYGKCIVGAHFFHGLSFFIAKYLHTQYKIPIGHYYSALLEEYKKTDSYFNKEYLEISSTLKESLFNLRPWGRKIFGQEDMYWSDQAAATMAYINDSEVFYKELQLFITAKYPQIDLAELQSVCQYNKDSLERPNISYPYQSTYKYNWFSYFNDGDKLVNENQSIIINGTNWESVKEHALQVYWYGRKSKRCFIKDIKVNNDKI